MMNIIGFFRHKEIILYYIYNLNKILELVLGRISGYPERKGRISGKIRQGIPDNPAGSPTQTYLTLKLFLTYLRERNLG